MPTDEQVRAVADWAGITETQARSVYGAEGFDIKAAFALRGAPWPPFQPDIIDLDEMPPEMAARAAARSQPR